MQSAIIGRRGDEPPERQPALVGRRQRDRAAHRMGEREMRLRHEGDQDLVADRLEVAAVIGEAPHMALAGDC